MTVKELIELLQDFDQDATVFSVHEDQKFGMCLSPITHVKVNDITEVDSLKSIVLI